MVIGKKENLFLLWKEYNLRVASATLCASQQCPENIGSVYMNLTGALCIPDQSVMFYRKLVPYSSDYGVGGQAVLIRLLSAKTDPGGLQTAGCIH